MAEEETQAAAPAAQADNGDWDQTSEGGTLFKFDKVGDMLSGLLINKKNGKTKMGDADFYTILSAKSEDTFIPTKALKEDIEKYLRMYGGLGHTLIEITFTEEKPGNFASPFKIFRVRAGAATESRLAARGIKTFDSENTSGEDELPH